MIYFLLPPSPATLANRIHASIYLSSSAEPIASELLISHSMHRYATALKSQISSHSDEWNMYKKYTNPYEYLHSCPPQHNLPVAKLSTSPLYFHSLEIYKTFPDILNPYHRQHHYPQTSFTSFVNVYEQQKLHKKQGHNNTRIPNMMYSPAEGMHTFHLSENTGGSIKAVQYLRNNPSDQHFTMSSSVASSKITDYIEFGADGTGDLLHPGNFDECCAKHRRSFDLITAFAKPSADNYLTVLWAQICYAICMQKPGGNFILRAFDCFTASMVDILYLLAGFYGEVKIAKLQTSRVSSSEKYLVCRRFCGGDFAEYFAVMRQSYYQLLHINAMGKSVRRFLNIPIPKYFLQRIEEMNAVLGQPQLENMHYTLSLINKHAKYDRNDQIVRQNIVKCINWCTENNIPYHHPSKGGEVPAAEIHDIIQMNKFQPPAHL